VGRRPPYMRVALSPAVKAAQEIVDKDPVNRALVYRVTSPSGKSYIGVTSNLNHRLRRHAKNRSHIGNSIRAYGIKNHVTEVLAVLPKEEAFALEQRAIEAFGTLAPNGMNLVSGGLGMQNPSAETRTKLSDAGRNISPETRAKMVAAQMGRIHSEESRAARRGQRRSAETRAKMSTSHKGKTHSIESKAKISRAVHARYARPTLVGAIHLA